MRAWRCWARLVCCAAAFAAAGFLVAGNPCDDSNIVSGGTSVVAFRKIKTHDAASCCALCASQDQCGHFTFDPKKVPNCHLKDGPLRQRLDTKGAVSGPFVAPPPPPPPPPPSPPAKGAPNLVLLFPDQWRFDWAGFNQAPSGPIPLNVPTLKSLAANGTRFSQAYVPAPVCAPSRSCLASGRQYDDAGVPSNFANDYPINQTTFYSVLQQHGYHTMTAGKDDLTKASQLGSRTKYDGCSICRDGDGLYHQAALGFADGFRYSGKMDVVDKPTPHDMYGFYLRNHTKLTEKGINVTAWDAHRACMGKDKADLCDANTFTEDMYEDDYTAQNAIALLRRRPKNVPFFLQVNFPGPHSPFLVTAKMHTSVSDGRVWPPAMDDPKHVTPGGTCASTKEPNGAATRCNYAAEIENLDRLFKAVLDEIESQDLLQNTVVCVSSDHGEMLGDHGDTSKSKPWQASASVPLVCAGPGIKQQVIDRPVGTIDLGATFIELAQAPLAPTMQTVSLVPLLRGDTRNSSYRAVVPSGLDNWRMVVQNMNGSSFKYICCKGDCPNPPSTAPKPVDGWTHMLVNVTADPFDMVDLAPKRPDIVSHLVNFLPSEYAKGCGKHRT